MFWAVFSLVLGIIHHPIDSSLRVMSFNIRYGTANDGENHWNKRKDFLCQTIKKFNPDLLGTQETLAFQRDYLLKELPHFKGFGVGRDDGKLKGEMAALFYRSDRFKLIEGGHFWLSPTPDKVGSKGWDAALPRIATWVKLKDRQQNDARPLLFLNTHFDHMGKEARKESARLIRQKIDELGQGHTIIVTGDFNAGEGTAPYQALFGNDEGNQASIIDTFRIKHPQRGNAEGTFNGFKPDARNKERIDWIGCSRDLKVKDAAIDHTTKDGKVPSDHFPVTAILVRHAK